MARKKNKPKSKDIRFMKWGVVPMLAAADVNHNLGELLNVRCKFGCLLSALFKD